MPSNRKCHCPGHTGNGTCKLRPGGFCYAFVQEVVDTSTSKTSPEFSYGCLPPDESGYMQCQGELTRHMIPRSIKCCSNMDMCNKNLTVMYKVPTYDMNADNEGPFTLYGYNVFILLGPLFVLSILLVFLLFMLHRELASRSRSKRNGDLTSIDSTYLDSDEDNSFNHEGSDDGRIKCDYSICEITDSSGGNVPMLVQRTIAQDIEWISVIGRGRYGLVNEGRHRGKPVAIKVFQTIEEASWLREQSIYNTCLLRHENILGFIATDIRGAGGSTLMLLITEYHKEGSLYDFLNKEIELNEMDTIQLMSSIACGLDHLHTVIAGKQSKPAIAHRDMKSKNILVKSNMTCCIADFGLSVIYDPNTRELNLEENPRVGTKRYMSPEILDESIRMDDFESFKRADVYAFALILWEISRRCVTDGVTEEYQIPYEGFVPNDPSFDEMRQLVCDEKIRPDISMRWEGNAILKPITKLMLEGWNSNPKVRPTARKMKKDLQNLKVKAEKAVSEKKSVPIYHPKLAMDCSTSYTKPNIISTSVSVCSCTNSSCKIPLVNKLQTPQTMV